MTGSIFHIALSTPCWLGQGAARLHGRMRLKSCCESFGKTCCSMFNWNNCDVDKFDSLWFQMYLQLFLSVYRFVLIRLSANTMVHDGTSIYFENLWELGLTHELFTMLLPGALQGETWLVWSDWSDLASEDLWFVAASWEKLCEWTVHSEAWSANSRE